MTDARQSDANSEFMQIKPDPDLEVDGDGFTFRLLGVGVYALMPDPEEGTQERS